MSALYIYIYESLSFMIKGTRGMKNDIWSHTDKSSQFVAAYSGIDPRSEQWNLVEEILHLIYNV